MTPTAALPVLYSFRRCPYAMRARLALAVSGQACELREVVLRAKPQALLLASPKATVPVLVLPQGEVIAQSLDIMLWALQRHDPQGWLRPAHGDLAAMLAVVAECDGPFKQALDRCKYPSRYPDAPPEAAWQAAQHCLTQWEARLAQHPWLMGATPSLADMAIAPFVRQFAAIDAGRWLALPLPGLQAWLQRFIDSPLLASVMPKLPAWVDGTAGVPFPFAPALWEAQEPPNQG